MLTIYKYPLKITDRQTVNMPFGAAPVSVGEQGGQLVVWAKVNTNHSCEPLSFRVCGTGHPVLDDETAVYIGTVQMENGLVWHVSYIPV